MLRHLRYAPAVAFGLLALAFVGLWVRSYTWVDTIIGPVGEARTFSWGSVNGIFATGVSGNIRPEEWTMQSYPARPRTVSRWQRGVLFGLGFSYPNDSTGVHFQLPYWFLALSSFALAGLLAFKPITRFTVRGLLITTTLLAAVLGLAVYAV
jgi:hypothetical protein